MATKKAKSTTETVTEEVKVKGERLLETVKRLVQEGNVRSITIKDKHGKKIATFPLTFGVIGALVAPVFAAIGAIAALVTECTISIERDGKKKA